MMEKEVKTADELLADGLVAKLELEPGKAYVLLFQSNSISSSTMSAIGSEMRVRGLDVMFLRIGDRPREAFLGIEIQKKG